MIGRFQLFALRSGALERVVDRAPPLVRTFIASTAPSAKSSIPIITTLPELRAWRSKARAEGKSVGIVPTMGALHRGHLDLVKHSIAANRLTVVTIFVNPTQFAPHEDLASYPRTMQTDLAQLEKLLDFKSQQESKLAEQSEEETLIIASGAIGETEMEHGSDTGAESSSATFPSAYPSPERRHRQPTPSSLSPISDTSLIPSTISNRNPSGISSSPLVVFAPTQSTIYPLSSISGPSTSGTAEDRDGGETMLQDTRKQRGAFVEVKGWGDVMEGKSRPQFFRGVATVCTKLFNAVEPDHAYFGQKDIQQALILKIMLRDLLSASPEPENLHVIPTTRDSVTHLALSSRNAYLTDAERLFAPTLHRALSVARELLTKSGSAGGSVTGRDMVGTAQDIVREAARAAKEQGVEMKLDYIEVFDKESFVSLVGVQGEPVSEAPSMYRDGKQSVVREAVISGAMWVGRTRLIDNLLIGWEC